MADLRQSGNLEEDADLMVALYRDDMYIKNSPREGIMEFIIRKARNGPIGTVDLKFLNNTVDITGRRVEFNWNNNAED
jgi:replicative DNA helicase